MSHLQPTVDVAGLAVYPRAVEMPTVRWRWYNTIIQISLPYKVLENINPDNG